jgi:hypothetical protein
MQCCLVKILEGIPAFAGMTALLKVNGIPSFAGMTALLKVNVIMAL